MYIFHISYIEGGVTPDPLRPLCTWLVDYATYISIGADSPNVEKYMLNKNGAQV